MPLWFCLRWPETTCVETAEATVEATEAVEAVEAVEAANSLQQLALAMLRYTPRVACFRQDSVVLEVAGSLSLFGGVRQLHQRIRQTAQSLQPGLRLGMAPSATGAWLLAGSSRGVRRVLRIQSLVHHLAKLPVHSLPEAQNHLNWLNNIGCRSLGELRQLPRQGLQQRSSPVLLRALDAAHAQVQESLAWFAPPARFRQARDLDFHLQQAASILAASQPLLLALCGWLQNRQEALHDFRLIIHHEKGRQACPATQLALRFSAATWLLEDFNRVLKEQLQHCTLRRPAIRLELLAGPSLPRAPVSETLFPDPFQHVQEEQRLLDLLAARLGAQGIRRPRPLAHHLPEQVNQWASNTAPMSAGNPSSAVIDKPRPFWLLPQPQQLSMQQERPLHQGRPLRLVQGPERIETGWYAGTHHRRDYFVAEDKEGARYWVYRERETGEHWFLHGLFA